MDAVEEVRFEVNVGVNIVGDVVMKLELLGMWNWGEYEDGKGIPSKVCWARSRWVRGIVIRRSEKGCLRRSNRVQGSFPCSGLSLPSSMKEDMAQLEWSNV